MRHMPSQLDTQWARSLAAVLIGFALLCGAFGYGGRMTIPGELEPVVRLIATAACIVAPGPLLTPPGAAPRLDIAAPGR